MKQDYKLIKESFFNSYKSFVDFISLTYSEPCMYNILVLRKQEHNNLTRVSIIIRNSNNNDGDSYQEFVNNMILSNIEAKQLINDIREDFKNNHIIAYSAVNPRSLIQTLQNTKFSLNIKLENEYELGEAINFNDQINCNEGRHLVLTRN